MAATGRSRHSPKMALRSRSADGPCERISVRSDSIPHSAGIPRALRVFMPPARARETRITRPPATFCRYCADSSSPRPRPLPSSPWSPAETERSNRHARSPTATKSWQRPGLILESAPRRAARAPSGDRCARGAVLPRTNSARQSPAASRARR